MKTNRLKWILFRHLRNVSPYAPLGETEVGVAFEPVFFLSEVRTSPFILRLILFKNKRLIELGILKNLSQKCRPLIRRNSYSNLMPIVLYKFTFIWYSNIGTHFMLFSSNIQIWLTTRTLNFLSHLASSTTDIRTGRNKN